MICVWKIYLYLQFFSFLLLMQLLWGWKTFFYSHHSLENFAYLLEVSYQDFLRYIADYYHAKAFLHFCYFSVDLYRKRNRYRKIGRVPNDNRLIVKQSASCFLTTAARSRKWRIHNVVSRQVSPVNSYQIIHSSVV